jgi:hypothetical protein
MAARGLSRARGDRSEQDSCPDSGVAHENPFGLGGLDDPGEQAGLCRRFGAVERGQPCEWVLIGGGAESTPHAPFIRTRPPRLSSARHEPASYRGSVADISLRLRGSHLELRGIMSMSVQLWVRGVRHSGGLGHGAGRVVVGGCGGWRGGCELAGDSGDEGARRSGLITRNLPGHVLLGEGIPSLAIAGRASQRAASLAIAMRESL